MRKLTHHINRTINELKSDGILFSFDTETITVRGKEKLLDNITFKKGDKELKIWAATFFRDFGQSAYYKKVKDDYVYVNLDDETFYEFQKIMIKHHLN